ncbi:MAG: radical SAM protein [Candidatus Omnitrophica bacterium]|nr:radical SAM protein [Candidatus Omnitrophota bacterium]
MVFNGMTPFPFSVNFLITKNCNFNCEICSWKGCEDTDNNSSEDELRTDEIKRFIRELKVHKPLLHLGGGEPFMRKDIGEILVSIKDNGLRCIVTTNGFLLNEHLIDMLINLEVDGIIFSLYGWGERHDDMTGTKGSFEKTIDNLKLVLDKRRYYPRVYVSTVPIDYAEGEIHKLTGNLKALGIDGLKVEQLNYLSQEEYGKSLTARGPFDLRPRTLIKKGHMTIEESRRMMSMLRALSRTYDKFVFIKPDLSDNQLIDWYAGVPKRKRNCLFIAHSLFINYNGDIIPCQFFPQCRLGNIRKDQLRAVWNSGRYRELRKTINSISPLACARCCKN